MPALLVFVVFLIAIAVSIPIGVSMILGSIAPIFLMGKGGSIVQLLNNTFSGANSTPILAVPLFILGGVIMAKGGISKKLFNFFSYFAGRMPGELIPAFFWQKIIFEAYYLFLILQSSKEVGSV